MPDTFTIKGEVPNAGPRLLDGEFNGSLHVGIASRATVREIPSKGQSVIVINGRIWLINSLDPTVQVEYF